MTGPPPSWGSQRLWPDADDRTRAAVEHLMASALQDPADLVRTGGDPHASDLRK